MRPVSARRALPLAAYALGAWVALNGVGHVVGSLQANLPRGAYDFRLASLMTLGLTLAFAGALHALCAPGLRAGAAWAWRISGATALFTILLILLLAPVLAAWGLLALHVAYLGILVATRRAPHAPPGTAPTA